MISFHVKLGAKNGPYCTLSFDPVGSAPEIGGKYK